MCKNSTMRGDARTNVRPKATQPRKRSLRGSIAANLRKIILATFRFVTFSHKLGSLPADFVSAFASTSEAVRARPIPHPS